MPKEPKVRLEQKTTHHVPLCSCMFGCKLSAWPSTHNSPVWCDLLLLMSLEWLLQSNPLIVGYLLLDYNLMFLSAFLRPGREASVHAGPYAAEGQLSVYSPTEKQHGIWFHYHWRWRTGWVSTGQKCHTGRACCTGWENGYR